MKTIKVKPVESYKIELTDRSFVCSFNMLAMAYFNEEIAKLDGTLGELSNAHLCALILYAGIKPNEPDFTMEEANALAVEMDPSMYGYFMSEFSNTLYESVPEKDKAVAKKLLAQHLRNALK